MRDKMVYESPRTTNRPLAVRYLNRGSEHVLVVVVDFASDINIFK